MSRADGVGDEATPSVAPAAAAGPAVAIPGTYAFGNERQVQPERLGLLAGALIPARGATATCTAAILALTALRS